MTSPRPTFHMTTWGAGAPVLFESLRATMQEQPQWEVDIPLDVLAAQRIPALIFTGGWSRAFDAIATVLAEKLGAGRVILPGAGHGVQLIGEPFNQRVRALWESTLPEV